MRRPPAFILPPGIGLRLGNGRSRGFTVLELLTVSSIVSLLAAVLLPAMGSVRESARGLECGNHLRQIGLAFHSYEGTWNCLPSGLQWESTRQSAYGWGVSLLPQLGQSPLAGTIDRARILQDARLDPARHASLEVFLCPSDIVHEQFVLYRESDATLPQATPEPLVSLPTANYFGVYGVSEPDEAHEQTPPSVGEGAFLEDRPVRLREFERGVSQTLFVGERSMSRVPSTWLGVDGRGEDAACRLVGNAATSPNCEPCDECEFASRHPGGANFLWGDGRVRLVSSTIDARVYRQSARRDGNPN